MRIGIDFDNTLVCYDALFHRLAVQQKLIPAEVPVGKGQVRDYLRRTGREEDWTRLQGLVYGDRLQEAPPTRGARDLLVWCRQHKAELWIISHKTRHPVLGPKLDLHNAAHRWLSAHGFYDYETGLHRSLVYFEPTLEAKLERIRERRCSHFIDDLPEFLAEPNFPAGVERVLFDPGNQYPAPGPWQRVASWSQLRLMMEPALAEH